jgi:pilus assembly protein Flp/PilA
MLADDTASERTRKAPRPLSFDSAVQKELYMSGLLRRFVREDDGQDLVEYAMLVALIAIVCVGGVTALGTALNTWYDGVSSQIPLGS